MYMKTFLIAFLIMLSIVSIANAQQVRIAETDTTTLTAPGYSRAVSCYGGYTKVLWYFKIANIDTKVSVALQAKKGHGEWTSVFADSIAYTENGNFGFEWDGCALADSLRLWFVSEAGGTAATITHNAALYGGN